MAYTLTIGNYDRHGWFTPHRVQNTRRYKTINGARRAAYNRLMEFRYNWASAESPVVYIRFNGSDYGYAEQAVKKGRKYIAYKGSSTDATSYELLSNGTFREI